jgi:PPIC-type PPIASE domain
LAGAAQAQAQPGAGAENPANAPSKTSAAPPDQRVVLKVGDQQITQAAFEQYISDLESQQGPATLSREKLGDSYASLLMLEQLAKANHLDTSPDVIRLLAIDRMQILSNAEFAKLKAEAAPTPEEIKAYYNSHLDDFDVAEVQRIFIWSGDPNKPHSMTPAQAKALADAVRNAIKSGGDVPKVVSSAPHSPDEVLADTAPLRFRRGELAPGMNDKIFALKEGEWKEFDNGPNEYVFVHLVKRSSEDLKDATPEITKKVAAEKLRDELSKLKSKTGIWMDETYFASNTPKPSSNSKPEPSGQSKDSTERGEKSE